MIKQLDLPHNVLEVLKRIYCSAREHNPRLTEADLIGHIVTKWMEGYCMDEPGGMTKDRAKIKNDLKVAIALSGKTQKQIAQEIGMCNTYLNRIMKGKSEPSISIAYLIAGALGYPPWKVHELFYLVPSEE